MTLSIFAILAAVFGCVLVVATDARGFHRRLHRPRLVRAVVLGTSAVLFVLNSVCAVMSAQLPTAAGSAVLMIDLVLGSMVAGLVTSSRIGSTPSPLPRRVLAIGAHPDDLELACGGTLARLADSGHEIRALVMSHGGQGGRADLRPQEAQRGAGFLGATGIEVHDFPDTRLGDHDLEMVSVIEAAIRRFNPDVVLTHSGNDQHQDHQAVHLATLRAGRQHSTILCYESPSATPAFAPSVFVNIEDYVEVKVAAVSAHRDQAGKPYMTPERVRGLAIYRGSQAKIISAEAYEPVRLVAGGVL